MRTGPAGGMSLAGRVSAWPAGCRTPQDCSGSLVAHEFDRTAPMIARCSDTREECVLLSCRVSTLPEAPTTETQFRPCSGADRNERTRRRESFQIVQCPIRATDYT